MIINLPIYAITEQIWDRKIAVFCVRFFNRFMIFFLVPFFMVELSSYSKFFQTNVLVYFLATVLFIGVFPGPISPIVTKSLLFNIFNNRHIWKTGQINGLLRSFVLETVFPIIVFNSTVLFFLYNHGYYTALFYFSVVFICLSCLTYPPMAISFSIIAIYLNLQIYGCLKIIILLAVLILTLTTIRKYIHGDNFGREVLNESIKLSAIFRLGYWNIIELIMILFVPVILFCINFEFTHYLELIFIFTLFVFFNFSPLHNFSRIWFRGAAPFYQLLVIFLLTKLISISITQTVFLIAGMAILFIIYFMTQFNYLNKMNYFKTAADIDSMLLSKLKVANYEHNSISLYTINPSEIMLLGLYSDVFAQNIAHGVGAAGFEFQLSSLVKAYKYLGKSKYDLLEIFEPTDSYAEWLKKRDGNILSTEFLKSVASYQIQFLCTYMTYNNLLTDLGYINSGLWTDKFRDRLMELWDM